MVLCQRERVRKCSVAGARRVWWKKSICVGAARSHGVLLVVRVATIKAWFGPFYSRRCDIDKRCELCLMNFFALIILRCKDVAARVYMLCSLSMLWSSNPRVP